MAVLTLRGEKGSAEHGLGAGPDGVRITDGEHQAAEDAAMAEVGVAEEAAAGFRVKWTARLGSQTHGGPVSAQGRVYIGTNNDPPRDPRHRGDCGVLLCLDAATGRLRWQLVVPKLREGSIWDPPGIGLISTPCVAGSRVYVITPRCEALCLDPEGMANGNDGTFQDEAAYVAEGPEQGPVAPGLQDADILWRYSMLDELGVFPRGAGGGSILAVGNVLYAPTGNGVDWTDVNVPAPKAPSLIALDGRTGALLGTDEAGIGERVFRSQGSSAAAGVFHGRQLIFFGGGDGWLYTLDGQPAREKQKSLLKVVWKADCNPSAYRSRSGRGLKYGDADGPSEIRAAPTLFKNRVYAVTGQEPDRGEGVGRLVCFNANTRRTGDTAKRALYWDYRGIGRSLSSVAVDPGQNLAFAADHGGVIHCLHARTGELQWTHDTRSHIRSSPLVTDGRVWIGDEAGNLWVMAARREKRVLGRINLGAPIHSTPFLGEDGVVYAAAQTRLYALVRDR